MEGVIVPVRLTIEEILKELQLISGKYSSKFQYLKIKTEIFQSDTNLWENFNDFINKELEAKGMINTIQLGFL